MQVFVQFLKLQKKIMISISFIHIFLLVAWVDQQLICSFRITSTFSDYFNFISSVTDRSSMLINYPPFYFSPSSSHPGRKIRRRIRTVWFILGIHVFFNCIYFSWLVLDTFGQTDKQWLQFLVHPIDIVPCHTINVVQILLNFIGSSEFSLEFVGSLRKNSDRISKILSDLTSEDLIWVVWATFSLVR